MKSVQTAAERAEYDYDRNVERIDYGVAWSRKE